MPLISVVVTVYNLERYIGACLESLSKQNFDDFEVVVADNGSTDGSLEICRRYVREGGGKFRLLELPQPSVMHRAHQAGLNSARGAYVHIIDGDDTLRRGYLLEAAAMIAAQSPDVIIGRYTCEAEGDALSLRDVELDARRIDGRDSEAVIGYLRSIPNYHLAFWRYIFKKSILKTPLFSSALKQNRECPLIDALFSFRILMAAQSFALIETPFYHYRRYAESVTGDAGRQKRWHMQVLYEFINFLYAGGYEGEKRGWIADKLYQELCLALCKSDLYSSADWAFFERLLEASMQALACLDSGNTLPLYHHLTEGIRAFFDHARATLINWAKGQHEVFLFPCGRLSQDVYRWLQNAACTVIGFLDSNPIMQGRRVQDIVCYDPNVLKNAHNGSVVIASIYEGLTAQLSQKCMGYGIERARIWEIVQMVRNKDICN